MINNNKIPKNPKRLDLTGQTFGHWTALSYDPYLDENGKLKRSAWLCKCACGNTKKVQTDHLRSGASTCCGCMNMTKNGLSSTRICHIYSDMIRRCTNEKHDRYKWYGGKGIKVCDEWLNDFMSFYNWAMENGYSDNLTIDRIDFNKDYEPDNCRWITIQEQQRGKSNGRLVTINGETKQISEWAETTGIHYNTLYTRWQKGWRDKDLIKPLTKRKKYDQAQ